MTFNELKEKYALPPGIQDLSNEICRTYIMHGGATTVVSYPIALWTQKYGDYGDVRTLIITSESAIYCFNIEPEQIVIKTYFDCDLGKYLC